MLRHKQGLFYRSDIVAGVCLLIGAGMFIVAVIGMRLACIASPDVNDIEMMERRSGSESERVGQFVDCL